MLKSVSNEFHGAGYEFLRNSAMNARNFFDPSVGHLAYNYFGGNVGGPIKKNKIFFFGDFLRTTDHEANTNLGTIPPNSWRNGNLSTGSTQIYDPATGNADGTNLRLSPTISFHNRISPIAAKIRPGAGNQPAIERRFSETTITSRCCPSQRHEFVRCEDRRRTAGQEPPERAVQLPIGGHQAPIFDSGQFRAGRVCRNRRAKTYSTGINYNRIFSPTLISEFRVGVPLPERRSTATSARPRRTSGIPASTSTSGPAAGEHQPQRRLSGPMVGYSAAFGNRAEANIGVVNTWTKTTGNHHRWGADYRRLRDDLLQTQSINPRGSFNFGTAQTSLNAAGIKTSAANNFASFLLDQPSDGGRDIAAYFPALRGNQFFLFAQDKWQVSSKLTLDFGLRWEFYPPPTPAFAGGFSNYNADNNTLELGGIGSVPKNLGLKTDYKYFAPRLGIAYRANNSTVIRTGFGVSYTPFPDNTYAYNFPVKQNNQYTSGASNYQPAVTGNGQFFSMATGFPAPQLAAIPSNGIITNPALTQSDIVIPKDYKNPYVESWNFSVQRSLPAHFTLDVAYVGNHGVRTAATYNLNVPNTVSQMGIGLAGRPLYQKFGRTADTTQYFVGYSSMYNGLQVKLNRRFFNGLSVTTAYTLAKGMSFQTGDDGGIWNYIYPRRSYARTDFDRHQTFVQSWVYDCRSASGNG
jgi:hypothetical protein